MQLITNKVHLASQRCLIPGSSQVVSICRDTGVDRAGIVVGTDLCGELAGYHGHARRGTEGGGAVCRVEDNGASRKSIEVWGLDLGLGVVDLEERSSELVCHDIKDVWLL